ncbi:glycosyltransferase [Plastorhodobacter daqingensis]|uniref:Glycosyltransferase n=1 Tax=Plastorhodobacter daqingensis TaxID=1387281 RepID=A0ABW2UNQ6_9RHOB
MSREPPLPERAPPAQAVNRYWSVDSAPARLTRDLPRTAAPMVLLVFTLVSTILLFMLNEIPLLAQTFPQRDFVFSPYTGTHSIPLRTFILSFYIAFAAVVATSSMRKLKFLFDMIAYFVILCCAFDVLNVILHDRFGWIYSLHVVQIISGLFGFLIFSVRLLAHGSMPPRAHAPFSHRFKVFAFVRLTLAILLAILGSVMVGRLDPVLVSDLRQIALLGGTGPGVFLFLPMLSLVLYVDGIVQAILRRKQRFAPPVTVIIPAHNEAHIITRTIAALDAAAGVYGSPVTVLVLDNCSEDDTAGVARAAFAQAAHVTGRIVDVPVPGKAIALNRGIEETATDYVVRIDADTQVRPDTLWRAMRHFSREGVGTVGGMPLPPGGGPFDRARELEVLLKHGFYQVGYGAADCIVGIPGMFAAYRTDCVRTVGGFVTGMNGEDTDVAVRIGESGFRTVGDPSVVYISEVPLTYRHLREQRMRWFRSIYHVSARNMDYLDGRRFSVRGKIVLPFMLINSARRAMMLPLAIFGLLYLVFAFDPEGSLTVQAALAVLIGAPTLMAGFAALANGRPRALLALPEYTLFRILRAYLTLEAMLSIAFADPQNGKAGTRLPAGPAGAPSRRLR